MPQPKAETKKKQDAAAKSPSKALSRKHPTLIAASAAKPLAKTTSHKYPTLTALTTEQHRALAKETPVHQPPPKAFIKNVDNMNLHLGNVTPPPGAFDGNITPPLGALTPPPFPRADTPPLGALYPYGNVTPPPFQRAGTPPPRADSPIFIERVHNLNLYHK